MAESRRIPGGAPAERFPLPLGMAQTEISTRLLLAGESLLQWTGAWFPWTPSVFVEAIATDPARERRQQVRPRSIRLTGSGRKG